MKRLQIAAYNNIIHHKNDSLNVLKFVVICHSDVSAIGNQVTLRYLKKQKQTKNMEIK